MKKYLLVFLALSFFAYAACQQKTNAEKEMKALSETYLKVLNGGDLSVVDEIFSPQYVLHKADGMDIVGIEAMKEDITYLRTGFPDFHITFDEQIIEGDKMVTRWTATGTNTGSMGDLPPTGKKFNITGATIGVIADGKVREEWEFYNMALMMVQLGFTIAPPAE